MRGCTFLFAGSFILPETGLALLGLTIESEYHLERDEGSDFFKSIPHKTNGRDATGLGLNACMLGGLLPFAFEHDRGARLGIRHGSKREER